METSRAVADGIRTVSSLSPDDLAVARAVLAASSAEDGREAVSEAGRLRLRVDSPRADVRHVLASESGKGSEGGEPIGYAQLESGADAGAAVTVELAVHPAARGRGWGRRLVDAVLGESGPSTVDFWAHGGHPAARHLAEVYGAELVRELRQMRRTAEAPDEQPLPAGVTLRTFVPGTDERAWLALNAEAFAHHPEQGSWTEADLADRIAEPWFDPAGFFLAERDGRLVGFHWTKVHPDGLGEVYVVGVAPSEQGSGLGRALTAVGLRHLLLDRKAGSVLLYVDADNPAAVRVYERLGFTIHEVDLMYRLHRAHRG